MVRGSEFGGSKTTINGNKFEDKASVRKTLSDNGYNIDGDDLYNEKDMLIGRFYKKEKLESLIDLLNLRNHIGEGKIWTTILKPDDALYIPSTKDLYIFEMKYQNGDGSVSEKPQTGIFKKEYYEDLFKEIGKLNVHYCYILCDYFKKISFEPMYRILCRHNVDYFFNAIDKDYIDLSNVNGPIQKYKLW